jgi:aminoglycoside/choline kinase family phosphotransferase
MAHPMTPPAAAADFLGANGWGGARIDPLAGDASFRRYFRVTDGARRAVLMDAPPPENIAAFIAMARWLSERSFAAPAIHAVDMERGLVLLEDFGDARLREAADADPVAALPLYADAVDLLVRLRTFAPPELPAYDLAFLHREVALVIEWYCPAVGHPVDAAGYRAAWDAVLGQALADPPVTVLRDYHAENLMLVGPTRTLGLLDFQDALAGHPAYDLVSLLKDARRDVEPETEEAMLRRYLAATGEGDAFVNAYHVLGAQRNAKILGLFARLWQRDGKAGYTALCPRVWRYLERDLTHPALAPVARWFDENLPAQWRGDPRIIAEARA